MLSRQIDAASEEIENWKDHEVNYIEMAHKLLAHGSFDLLASGNYHIYAGMLNPMNCSSSLLRVHSNSLEWAVKNKIIAQEDMAEQVSLLHRSIKEVG